MHDDIQLTICTGVLQVEDTWDSLWGARFQTPSLAVLSHPSYCMCASCSQCTFQFGKGFGLCGTADVIGVNKRVAENVGQIIFALTPITDNTDVPIRMILQLNSRMPTWEVVVKGDFQSSSIMYDVNVSLARVLFKCVCAPRLRRPMVMSPTIFLV